MLPLRNRRSQSLRCISQIEVRVLAHMSGDPHLCSMFRTAGSDVYVAMAAQVFGVSESAVTEVQRKQAKTVRGQLIIHCPPPFHSLCSQVCLGIIYGIGAQEAARKLSVPLHVASKLRSQFLSRYPLIGKFMDQVKEYLRSNGAFMGRAVRPQLAAPPCAVCRVCSHPHRSEEIPARHHSRG